MPELKAPEYTFGENWKPYADQTDPGYANDTLRSNIAFDRVHKLVRSNEALLSWRVEVSPDLHEAVGQEYHDSYDKDKIKAVAQTVRTTVVNAIKVYTRTDDFTEEMSEILDHIFAITESAVEATLNVGDRVDYSQLSRIVENVYNRTKETITGAILKDVNKKGNEDIARQVASYLYGFSLDATTAQNIERLETLDDIETIMARVNEAERLVEGSVYRYLMSTPPARDGAIELPDRRIQPATLEDLARLEREGKVF
tara:strand:- start:234 stop:1001 length:768 start_codon:yes stop_codon:yes gene_type:complete